MDNVRTLHSNQLIEPQRDIKKDPLKTPLFITTPQKETPHADSLKGKNITQKEKTKTLWNWGKDWVVDFLIDWQTGPEKKLYDKNYAYLSSITESNENQATLEELCSALTDQIWTKFISKRVPAAEDIAHKKDVITFGIRSMLVHALAKMAENSGIPPNPDQKIPAEKLIGQLTSHCINTVYKSISESKIHQPYLDLHFKLLSIQKETDVNKKHEKILALRDAYCQNPSTVLAEDALELLLQEENSQEIASFFFSKKSKEKSQFNQSLLLQKLQAIDDSEKIAEILSSIEKAHLRYFFNTLADTLLIQAFPNRAEDEGFIRIVQTLLGDSLLKWVLNKFVSIDHISWESITSLIGKELYEFFMTVEDVTRTETPILDQNNHFKIIVKELLDSGFEELEEEARALYEDHCCAGSTSQIRNLLVKMENVDPKVNQLLSDTVRTLISQEVQQNQEENKAAYAFIKRYIQAFVFQLANHILTPQKELSFSHSSRTSTEKEQQEGFSQSHAEKQAVYFVAWTFDRILSTFEKIHNLPSETPIGEYKELFHSFDEKFYEKCKAEIAKIHEDKGLTSEKKEEAIHQEIRKHLFLALAEKILETRLSKELFYTLSPPLIKNLGFWDVIIDYFAQFLLSTYETFYVKIPEKANVPLPPKEQSVNQLLHLMKESAQTKLSDEETELTISPIVNILLRTYLGKKEAPTEIDSNKVNQVKQALFGNAQGKKGYIDHVFKFLAQDFVQDHPFLLEDQNFVGTCFKKGLDLILNELNGIPAEDVEGVDFDNPEIFYRQVANELIDFVFPESSRVPVQTFMQAPSKTLIKKATGKILSEVMEQLENPERRNALILEKLIQSNNRARSKLNQKNLAIPTKDIKILANSAASLESKEKSLKRVKNQLKREIANAPRLHFQVAIREKIQKKLGAKKGFSQVLATFCQIAITPLLALGSLGIHLIAKRSSAKMVDNLINHEKADARLVRRVIWEVVSALRERDERSNEIEDQQTIKKKLQQQIGRILDENEISPLKKIPKSGNFLGSLLSNYIHRAPVPFLTEVLKEEEIKPIWKSPFHRENSSLA